MPLHFFSLKSQNKQKLVRPFAYFSRAHPATLLQTHFQTVNILPVLLQYILFGTIINTFFERRHGYNQYGMKEWIVFYPFFPMLLWTTHYALIILL